MNSLLTHDYAEDSPREATGVRVLKWIIKVSMAGAFLVALATLICNWWVMYDTRDQAYFNIDKLPVNEVGLVLGTSKFVASGKENLFFRYRMEASARLWKAGKVKFLILSGNNDSEYYNEPADMQRALVKLGVPTSVMTLDYAGYRTFDSVVRCKEVFNQEKITIISQNFHNTRALFISNHEAIQAVAFAAQDVPDGYSFRTLVREYLARPYAVLDVFLLRPQPKTDNWPSR